MNDFQAEASVTVPVDPSRFGITGSSLGAYTSWSAALKSNAFAVIVPFNWGIHFFADGITRNGNIERITAGPLASFLATPYDDVDLQNAFDAGSSSNPKGYKYADKELTPDGIKTLRVLAGVAPKAKAVVKGKGENLGLPTLPWPLVAQLQTTNGCWEVTYGTAAMNGPTVFKTK